jgi:hypothetical protein
MSRKLSIVIDDTSGYRSCGTCNLCCTVQGVAEIAKPINVKCSHLNTMGRCGIYATRPESCRTYKCLWLRGYLPENMKPVKSRAVVEHNETGDMLVMRVLPEDRRHIRRGILRDFIKKANDNHVPVIVVCGEERTLFGARQSDLDLIMRVQNVKEDGTIVTEEVTYSAEVMK